MGHLRYYCPGPSGDFNLCAVLLYKVLLQREKEEEKEARSEDQPERAQWKYYNSSGEKIGHCSCMLTFRGVVFF